MISSVNYNYHRTYDPFPISIPDVAEGKSSHQLRKTSGLDEVTKELNGRKIRYIGHQKSVPVERAKTMRRNDPSKNRTQDAHVTLAKGGGDCDDLAVLYAYKLQQRNNPHLEFGVVSGWSKTAKGNLYVLHALLAIRDKRYPNRYELYEVADPARRPVYAGSFNRFGPNNRFPTPKGNNEFILNAYVPVKNDGTRNLSSPTYFIP